MLTIAQNQISRYGYIIEGESDDTTFYMYQAYVIYPLIQAYSVQELMFEDYASRKSGGKGLFKLDPLYLKDPSVVLSEKLLYPLLKEHEDMLQRDPVMRMRFHQAINQPVRFKRMRIQ